MSNLQRIGRRSWRIIILVVRRNRLLLIWPGLALQMCRGFSTNRCRCRVVDFNGLSVLLCNRLGTNRCRGDVGRLDSMDRTLHFTISSSKELSLSLTKVNSLTPILECAQCESFVARLYAWMACRQGICIHLLIFKLKFLL